MQNINNIDSSYNDLSSNFISNLNNLNNSLQNLDSLIIDISNSDNSSVIIGKFKMLVMPLMYLNKIIIVFY